MPWLGIPGKNSVLRMQIPSKFPCMKENYRFFPRPFAKLDKMYTVLLCSFAIYSTLYLSYSSNVSIKQSKTVSELN